MDELKNSLKLLEEQEVMIREIYPENPHFSDHISDYINLHKLYNR